MDGTNRTFENAEASRHDGAPENSAVGGRESALPICSVPPSAPTSRTVRAAPPVGRSGHSSFIPGSATSSESATRWLDADLGAQSLHVRLDPLVVEVALGADIRLHVLPLRCLRHCLDGDAWSRIAECVLSAISEARASPGPDQPVDGSRGSGTRCALEINDLSDHRGRLCDQLILVPAECFRSKFCDG